MVDIRNFDLNLLVTFEALMLERSVTKAAERLYVGQPAMSYSLKKLREALSDELFVRTRTGMEPTSKALLLFEDVSNILASVRTQVLSTRAFEPAIEVREFRVTMTDFVEAAIMQELFEHLSEKAPNIRVVNNAVRKTDISDALESGQIDLAIGFFPEAHVSASRQFLFSERHVLVFDEDACGLTPPISLEEYCSIPHILFSSRGDATSTFDKSLAEQGLSRQVSFVTPHFLSVPFLLHGRKALTLLPSHLARMCKNMVGLSVSAPPFDVYDFDISMVWHPRTENDMGLKWLRAQIVDVLSDKANTPSEMSENGASN